MKWEHNEPHTTSLHSTIKYNDCYTCYKNRQSLFVLELYSLMFINHSNQTRRNNLGIWRNIGKIVILLFQIVHEQMKWTLRSFKRDTTKKSNTPKIEQKKIYLNEEQESLERSKLMVELCEKPYYNDQWLYMVRYTNSHCWSIGSRFDYSRDFLMNWIEILAYVWAFCMSIILGSYILCG